MKKVMIRPPVNDLHCFTFRGALQEGHLRVHFDPLPELPPKVTIASVLRAGRIRVSLALHLCSSITSQFYVVVSCFFPVEMHHIWAQGNFTLGLGPGLDHSLGLKKQLVIF